MYEYRLALEFWGALALAAFVTPLMLGGIHHLVDLFRHVQHDERCSLTSVPSTPGPV
ncbi:MAG TPA: hypothetical protein VHC69_17575 [Polyangiaceae bacterium]|nr:hypothetical protein [Polyangiaceae bacterium]